MLQALLWLVHQRLRGKKLREPLSASVDLDQLRCSFWKRSEMTDGTLPASGLGWLGRGAESRAEAPVAAQPRTRRQVGSRFSKAGRYIPRGVAIPICRSPTGAFCSMVLD